MGSLGTTSSWGLCCFLCFVFGVGFGLCSGCAFCHKFWLPGVCLVCVLCSDPHGAEGGFLGWRFVL